MTRRGGIPKPNQLTMEKRVRRIVRDHGDLMLEPHWPAKYAGYYRVTERTLRQWRRYAMLEGLIPTSMHATHIEQLRIDLGLTSVASRKNNQSKPESPSWITGLTEPLSLH